MTDTSTTEQKSAFVDAMFDAIRLARECGISRANIMYVFEAALVEVQPRTGRRRRVGVGS